MFSRSIFTTKADILSSACKTVFKQMLTLTVRGRVMVFGFSFPPTEIKEKKMIQMLIEEFVHVKGQ